MPCCAGFETDPLSDEVVEDLADGFKALGDPHRILIVHLLARAAEPVCVMDIEHHLSVGQSTVSHHLKTMVDAGVLTREKRGRWMYYSLIPERLVYLSRTLDSKTAVTA